MELHISVFLWCLWTPWRTPRRRSAAGGTAGAAIAIRLVLPAVGISYARKTRRRRKRHNHSSSQCALRMCSRMGASAAAQQARRARVNGKVVNGPPAGRRLLPVASGSHPAFLSGWAKLPVGSPTGAPNSATPIAPLLLKVGHLDKHGWGWRGDLFGAPASSPHT